MSTLLQPGDRCADHVILHHLATGDHAEVYATIGPTGEPRALKLVATDEGLAAKVHARLAQEGEALTLIVDPGVVRFYASGVWEDRVWISLELLEGETLRERLRAAGGRLPLEVALYWMAQVCAGLAEAHRVGVVHRDLTPDNIVVRDDDTAKVVDFGLAKLDGYGVKTTKEQAIGSAMYIAPEQAGGAPAHAAMDVYASAGVLYQAITGVPPMGGQPRTVMSMVAWHLFEQPPLLRALAPWAPSDVEALLHQALDKDPARRPSMRAFTDGLRDALSRLRAPQRREARNVPLPNREIPLAPTASMAVHDGPVTVTATATATATERPAVAVPLRARGGTILVVASEPPTPATDRSAMLPAAVAAAVTVPAPMPERASAPAGWRSTDVPVETSVRRSTASPRRAPVAALAVGALAVAAVATGWTLLGRGSDPGSGTAAATRPVASAVPSASASSVASAPTVIASASAAPGVVTPPKPTGAGVPARPAPRRTPAARPLVGPPAAKNRLFGTEG